MVGSATTGEGVRLRAVEPADLDQFYADQADARAAAMAGYASRDREAFDAHWRRVGRDPTAVRLTVLVDGAVAGNVVSWEQDGQRLVGYWISRPHWGRGVATQALGLLVRALEDRPLYAHITERNDRSARVLHKNGFRRDVVAEIRRGLPADGIVEQIFVLDGAPTGTGAAGQE